MPLRRSNNDLYRTMSKALFHQPHVPLYRLTDEDISQYLAELKAKRESSELNQHGESSKQTEGGEFSEPTVNEESSKQTEGGEFSEPTVNEESSEQAEDGEFSEPTVNEESFEQTEDGECSEPTVNEESSEQTEGGEFSELTVNEESFEQTENGKFSEPTVNEESFEQTENGECSEPTINEEVRESETDSNEAQFKNARTDEKADKTCSTDESTLNDSSIMPSPNSENNTEEILNKALYHQPHVPLYRLTDEDISQYLSELKAKRESSELNQHEKSSEQTEGGEFSEPTVNEESSEQTEDGEFSEPTVNEESSEQTEDGEFSEPTVNEESSEQTEGGEFSEPTVNEESSEQTEDGEFSEPTVNEESSEQTEDGEFSEPTVNEESSEQTEGGEFSEPTVNEESSEQTEDGECSEPTVNEESSEQTEGGEFSEPTVNEESSEQTEDGECSESTRNNKSSEPSFNEEFTEQIGNEECSEPSFNEEFTEQIGNEECSEPSFNEESSKQIVDGERSEPTVNKELCEQTKDEECSEPTVNEESSELIQNEVELSEKYVNNIKLELSRESETDLFKVQFKKTLSDEIADDLPFIPFIDLFDTRTIQIDGFETICDESLHWFNNNENKILDSMNQSLMPKGLIGKIRVRDVCIMLGEFRSLSNNIFYENMDFCSINDVMSLLNEGNKPANIHWTPDKKKSSLNCVENVYKKYFTKSTQDSIFIIANILHIISLCNKYYNTIMIVAKNKKETLKRGCIIMDHINILETKFVKYFLKVLSSFTDGACDNVLQIFFLSLITMVRVLNKPYTQKDFVLLHSVQSLWNSLKDSNFDNNKIFRTLVSKTFHQECIDILCLIEDGRDDDPGIVHRMEFLFVSIVNCEAFNTVINNISYDTLDFELLLETAIQTGCMQSKFKDPPKSTSMSVVGRSANEEESTHFTQDFNSATSDGSTFDLTLALSNVDAELESIVLSHISSALNETVYNESSNELIYSAIQSENDDLDSRIASIETTDTNPTILGINKRKFKLITPSDEPYSNLGVNVTKRLKSCETIIQCTARTCYSLTITIACKCGLANYCSDNCQRLDWYDSHFEICEVYKQEMKYQQQQNQQQHRIQEQQIQVEENQQPPEVENNVSDEIINILMKEAVDNFISTNNSDLPDLVRFTDNSGTRSEFNLSAANEIVTDNLHQEEPSTSSNHSFDNFISSANDGNSVLSTEFSSQVFSGSLFSVGNNNKI